MWPFSIQRTLRLSDPAHHGAEALIDGLSVDLCRQKARKVHVSKGGLSFNGPFVGVSNWSPIVAVSHAVAVVGSEDGILRVQYRLSFLRTVVFCLCWGAMAFVILASMAQKAVTPRGALCAAGATSSFILIVSTLSGDVLFRRMVRKTWQTLNRRKKQEVTDAGGAQEGTGGLGLWTPILAGAVGALLLEPGIALCRNVATGPGGHRAMETWPAAWGPTLREWVAMSLAYMPGTMTVVALGLGIGFAEPHRWLRYGILCGCIFFALHYAREWMLGGFGTPAASAIDGSWIIRVLVPFWQIALLLLGAWYGSRFRTRASVPRVDR